MCIENWAVSLFSIYFNVFDKTKVGQTEGCLFTIFIIFISF
jgi:hypothetical protein